MIIQMSAVLKRKCSGLIILYKVWKVLNQVLPCGFHRTHDFPSNIRAEFSHAPLFPYCVPKLLMLYCQSKELN